MRTRFQEQLDLLKEELTVMGNHVRDAVVTAGESVSKHDKEAAKKVPEQIAVVEEDRRRVDDICVRLLLLQQPVASDLRLIAASHKMVTEFARIASQASDIAEIVTLANLESGDLTEIAGKMADAVAKMLSEVLDAYRDRDAAAARQVVSSDDIIDDYFDEVKKDLLQMAQSPKVDGQYIIDLLMISKYLERMGDHTVNLAERVIYMLTGAYSNDGFGELS